MFTLVYEGKTFTVVYQPFAMSDATSTIRMCGVDAAEVRTRFERQFNGTIVSITEAS